MKKKSLKKKRSCEKERQTKAIKKKRYCEERKEKPLKRRGQEEKGH